MGWTCTTKQGRTLDRMRAGAGLKYALDWPTAGREYGTPGDQLVPVDVCAMVGIDIATGSGVARPLGRVYVHPEGELTGDGLALKVARELMTIGGGAR